MPASQSSPTKCQKSDRHNIVTLCQVPDLRNVTSFQAALTGGDKYSKIHSVLIKIFSGPGARKSLRMRSRGWWILLENWAGGGAGAYTTWPFFSFTTPPHTHLHLLHSIPALRVSINHSKARKVIVSWTLEQDTKLSSIFSSYEILVILLFLPEHLSV